MCIIVYIYVCFKYVCLCASCVYVYIECVSVLDMSVLVYYVSC